MLELNVQPDHVHLVISMAPTYSVSNTMGYLQGKLAIELFCRYPQLRRRFWGEKLWNRGDCVSTIGVGEGKVRKYVKGQEKLAETTQRRLLH